MKLVGLTQINPRVQVVDAIPDLLKDLIALFFVDTVIGLIHQAVDLRIGDAGRVGAGDGGRGDDRLPINPCIAIGLHAPGGGVHVVLLRLFAHLVADDGVLEHGDVDLDADGTQHALQHGRAVDAVGGVHHPEVQFEVLDAGLLQEFPGQIGVVTPLLRVLREP